MGRKLPEVTVIGAGLGGLSAAIHLRLAGHRVSVLEANAATGGRAGCLSLNGHRFDAGPTLLNYPWVFDQLFQAAGRRLADYVELTRIEPTITYFWPDGQHLTLFSEREPLRAELARFEPSAGPNLDRFFADAKEKFRIAFEKLIPQDHQNPLRYFSVLTARELLKTGLWRSMYSELGRFFSSRYIREAFGSYAMYLGGSPFRLPGLFSILPYGELAHGLWLPRGGIYALVEAVERLAREVGVQIYTCRRVTRILVSGERVRGVRLESGEVSPAELLVCNADLPAALVDLLGENPPRLTMSPAVLTYYWVVRERPAGLPHHTIFLPGDFRAAFRHLQSGSGLPAEPAFYLAAPPSDQPQAAISAPARIFVLVPLPLLSRLRGVAWAEATARIREHVLKRMAEAGVALGGSSILAEQVWTPLDWTRRLTLFDGSAFGVAHTLGQMGPFRPPNHSRRIRGLFFAGAGTNPGTGLPMVVLSGIFTARRIARHVR